MQRRHEGTEPKFPSSGQVLQQLTQRLILMSFSTSLTGLLKMLIICLGQSSIFVQQHHAANQIA
jgi:hypothetical protein